jgi:hypothetical protein
MAKRSVAKKPGKRKTKANARTETLVHSAAPIQALGVFQWPVTARSVKSLAMEMFGSSSRKALSIARKQLASLAVIELQVGVIPRGFDIGDLTQVPAEERDGSEQVPFDERFWSADGKSEIGFSMPERAPFRIVFFMHFFKKRLPLFLSDGTVVPLPPMAKLPSRLKSKLVYEAP